MSEEETIQNDSKQIVESLRSVINQRIIGQHEVVDQIIAALLARGHILLEGVPGTAKTLLVRILSGALGLKFGRVQFTPDLMPSDITGVSIYRETSKEFEFRSGPIFTDLLLADEINRAPAKTQSALLEAMQEKQVTVDGTTHSLGNKFTVFATQNPIEFEGTYPLPEAQLDRFLVNIKIDYPSKESEVAILDEYSDGFDAEVESTFMPSPVVSPEQLDSLWHAASKIKVASEIREYIADIVRATRDDSEIRVGASPRATIALFKIARAYALMDGRDYVIPDDVKEAAPLVLRHRISLAPELQIDGRPIEDVITSILSRTVAPQ